MNAGDYITSKTNANRVYKIVSIEPYNYARVEPKDAGGTIITVPLNDYRLATTDEYLKAFRNLAGQITSDEEWVNGYNNHKYAVPKSDWVYYKPTVTVSKSEKHDCATMGHKWVPYIGFTEAYDTCSCCPAKRESQ